MTDVITGVLMIFYILLFDPTVVVDHTVPALHPAASTLGVQR